MKKRRIKPCPECGSFELNWHGPYCSKQTLIQKAEQADVYYEAWVQLDKNFQKLRKQYQESMTLWQGKFRIVTHENNRLRKKIKNKKD